jgi:fatty-acyl-CoA synthase
MSARAELPSAPRDGTTPAVQPAIVAGPPLAHDPDILAHTVPEFLREVCQRYARREALAFVRDDGTTERWSYDELWMRSSEVAAALLASGMSKGTRVGVMMTNRPEMIASVFGAALAGGVATTLSTFATPDELDYLLRTSAVSYLLFEREVVRKDFLAMLGRLEPAVLDGGAEPLRSARFPFLRHLAAVDVAEPVGAVASWRDFLALGSSMPPAVTGAALASVTPSDPATLFFSSGSTSNPKGILSSHRAVAIQLCRWPRLYGLGGELRSWCANGYFWSGPFAMVLGATLWCGGTVVLQRTFEPARALALLEAERVTFPSAMPHQWVQMEQAPNWKASDLSRLRFVDTTLAAGNHPGVSTDWVQPTALYGGTEMFTVAVAAGVDVPAEEVAGSSGRPLAGTIVKIVDPDTRATLARGERGEIALKGPTLMMGYLGIPPEETFDGEGFYLSGDGGYIDQEGRLYWEGRLAEVIKTGGANVSPLEVDAALARFEAAKLVKTVGVPDPLLGEMVVSCVVPEPGGTVDEASVRAFLQERLASYKVPKRVLLFQEHELPMTATGKIKARELREIAARRLTG